MTDTIIFKFVKKERMGFVLGECTKNVIKKMNLFLVCNLYE